MTATNCTIAAGQSSCNTTLAWNTINPIGTSAVTTPTAITVATANASAGTPYSVAYGSRSFFLYNNAQKLNSAIATAVCASGTGWNMSVCALLDLTAGVPYTDESIVSQGVSVVLNADIMSDFDTINIAVDNIFQISTSANIAANPGNVSATVL